MLKRIPSIAKVNPFIDPHHQTMAELIDIVMSNDTLEAKRRQNVASSIRRFCAALDYEPSGVPANHWYFRERLKRFHPLEVGIKKKRWQTIKSDVAFALRLAGKKEGQPRPYAALSPEWTALATQLQSNDLKWGLSRLSHFCSAQHIAPKEVDDGIVDAYDLAVRRESFKLNPDQHRRDVCLLWNKATRELPDLSLRKVTLCSRRELYTLPWKDMPAEFRENADAWLETLSKEADLLSEEGLDKPLRPATIDAYRFRIRQAVAGALAGGASIEEIRSLSDLVAPSTAKAILQYFLDRNDGETSSNAASVAHILVLIAEVGGRGDEATIKLLKTFRKRLAVHSDGLRPRPRTALRPFTDRRNIEKILLLPQRIHERLRRKNQLTIQDAREMQIAVALELLLMRPIRRKNLVELQLGRSILKSARRTFIVIGGEAVKNEVDLDYRIPPESVAVLDFYTKNLLPIFGSNPEGWLFPGDRPDRPKSLDQFTRQFVKTIKEATGLHFYPHLSRHFGAFLWLTENPGAFEVVRRVLGHKSLNTTVRSYVSFDDDAAVQLFDKLVVRIRDAIKQEVGDD